MLNGRLGSGLVLCDVPMVLLHRTNFFIAQLDIYVAHVVGGAEMETALEIRCTVKPAVYITVPGRSSIFLSER